MRGTAASRIAVLVTHARIVFVRVRGRVMSFSGRELREAMTVDGAVGVALVDYESGMTLGTQGGGALLDLEMAGAGNTEVMRAKMKTMHALQLNDAIEDILITLGRQYHIIRPLAEAKGELFPYLRYSNCRTPRR